MSQHHRISVVYVDVCEEESEQIRLDELFGQIPTRELLEVLHSLTAEDVRWHQASETTFVHTLSNGVELTFCVGEEGYIQPIRRSQEQEVDQRRAGSVARQLQSALAEVREEANLVIHGVIGRAPALALPRVAREAGYEIVGESETHDNELHVIEKEVMVHVHETV